MNRLFAFHFGIGVLVVAVVILITFIILNKIAEKRNNQ